MLDRKTILKPVTITFRPWVVLLFVLCPPMWALIGLALWVVPWDSPNAPAWVQSVGAILAVLVAVWVASRQSKQQFDQMRHQEAEMLKKIVAIARYCATVCIAAREVVNEPGIADDELYLMDTGLDRAKTLLAEIPYHMVPESDASMGWVELRHAVSGVHAGIQKLINNPAFDERDRNDLRDAARRAMEAQVRVRRASTGHLPDLDLPAQ